MNNTNNSRLMRHSSLTIILLLGVGMAVSTQAQESTVRNAMQTQTRTEQNTVAAEQRVTRLAEQAQTALGEYRAKQIELERLRVYNRHLEELVNDQEEEKAAKQEELERSTTFEQEIVPLMLQMVDQLETFISLDVPFLPQERADRIADLQAIMGRADVQISEKYRRIMESYQIETDFGRTIEAYTGTIELDGVDRQVDFLRVGRLALAFQSRDRDITGFWNKETGAFEVLPNRFRDSVTEGLRIARKQRAPDMLSLPIPAPEPAS